MCIKEDFKLEIGHYGTVLLLTFCDLCDFPSCSFRVSLSKCFPFDWKTEAETEAPTTGAIKERKLCPSYKSTLRSINFHYVHQLFPMTAGNAARAPLQSLIRGSFCRRKWCRPSATAETCCLIDVNVDYFICSYVTRLLIVSNRAESEQTAQLGLTEMNACQCVAQWMLSTHTHIHTSLWRWRVCVRIIPPESGFMIGGYRWTNGAFAFIFRLQNANFESVIHSKPSVQSCEMRLKTLIFQHFFQDETNYGWKAGLRADDEDESEK